jgi:hypothetical protein
VERGAAHVIVIVHTRLRRSSAGGMHPNQCVESKKCVARRALREGSRLPVDDKFSGSALRTDEPLDEIIEPGGCRPHKACFLTVSISLPALPRLVG